MPSKFSTNSTYLSIYTHRKGDMLPITEALQELKKLYEQGIITPEEYEEKRQKLLKEL
jgi:hypothetical protein